MSRIRASCRAGSFYPANPDACRRALEEALEEASREGSARVPPADPEPRPVGGIVPHAGWMYSGSVAAATFLALRASEPFEDILFLGTSHLAEVAHPALDPSDAWETPLGPVEADRRLAARLLEEVPALRSDASAHALEHSIEVSVPFLRRLFPSARIVAIVLPPLCDGAALGAAAARACRAEGRRVVAVGSTDLTHYGPAYGFHPAGLGPPAHAWATEVNDRRLLEVVVELRAEAAQKEALRSRSACGPAALAAAVAFAREAGAPRGRILRHRTSLEARGVARSEDFVGYAAVVFGSAPAA